MQFDHGDGRAHVTGQHVNIHTVVDQRKGRKGVAQTLQGAVLLCDGTNQ